MFLAALLVACMIPAMATAIPPPHVIRERNLEADLIVVGEILGVKEDDKPPNFVVSIEHVIKGPDDISKENQLTVLFRPFPTNKGEIGARIQGMTPIKVQVGSLVVLYLERSRSHPGIYNPLLEGLSVITIINPLLPKKE